jgi:isopentenyl-diphosphate delta-isomerase
MPHPSKLQKMPDDPTASSRKRDHIELAFQSQIDRGQLDGRFYYEPMLSGHPQAGSLSGHELAGKSLKTPLWVSSMTGGTALAHTINHNLARACRDFGMGMGLGSCRSLLYGDDTLDDFNVRPTLGPDAPLFANLGIAQVDQLIRRGELELLPRLVDKLQADGLIIHVNPLQEWLQPEGDRYASSPVAIVEQVLEAVDFPLIVKKVGQGMGPGNLRALLQLPLAAVDFAANGGTNFAKLELLRNTEQAQIIYGPLALVGHSAEDMVELTNTLVAELGRDLRCRQLIISGGIRTFLDGYYCIQKVKLPAIYGMASAFLKRARGEYEPLAQFVDSQIQGLELAYAFLRIRQ